jgi:hypothetical protein
MDNHSKIKIKKSSKEGSENVVIQRVKRKRDLENITENNSFEEEKRKSGEKKENEDESNGELKNEKKKISSNEVEEKKSSKKKKKIEEMELDPEKIKIRVKPLKRQNLRSSSLEIEKIESDEEYKNNFNEKNNNKKEKIENIVDSYDCNAVDNKNIESFNHILNKKSKKKVNMSKQQQPDHISENKEKTEEDEIIDEEKDEKKTKKEEYESEEPSFRDDFQEGDEEYKDTGESEDENLDFDDDESKFQKTKKKKRQKKEDKLDKKRKKIKKRFLFTKSFNEDGTEGYRLRIGVRNEIKESENEKKKRQKFEIRKTHNTRSTFVHKEKNECPISDPIQNHGENSPTYLVSKNNSNDFVSVNNEQVLDEMSNENLLHFKNRSFRIKTKDLFLLEGNKNDDINNVSSENEGNNPVNQLDPNLEQKLVPLAINLEDSKKKRKLNGEVFDIIFIFI